MSSEQADAPKAPESLPSRPAKQQKEKPAKTKAPKVKLEVRFRFPPNRAIPSCSPTRGSRSTPLTDAFLSASS